MAGAKRWGKKAVDALFNGIGSYGLAWFQQRTDAPYPDGPGPEKRSVMALYKKAAREFGRGGFTRGAYTLRELMLSGYTREQIMRAREALKQKWKRLGPGGNYLITEEQSDEILEWLKHDYWSKAHRLYCCRSCTTEKRIHYGQGLCQRCYFRYRRSLDKHGLPKAPQALLAFVQNLDIGKSTDAAIVKGKIIADLKRGISLDEPSLDWLEMST